MAQVTYRGVKYDTNDSKQAKSQKVTLTYRGVKSEKELTAAQLHQMLMSVNSQALFLC